MSTVFEDIDDAFVQEILSQALSYPIKWPNAPFDTPNGEPWLRVNILLNQPAQTTIGSNGKDRINGFMQIDIFVPKGAGHKVPTQIADEINTNLKSGDNLASNGQKLRVVSVGSRQGTEDSVWYHQILRVDFYTQYTRL